MKRNDIVIMHKMKKPDIYEEGRVYCAGCVGRKTGDNLCRLLYDKYPAVLEQKTFDCLVVGYGKGAVYTNQKHSVFNNTVYDIVLSLTQCNICDGRWCSYENMCKDVKDTVDMYKEVKGI